MSYMELFYPAGEPAGWIGRGTGSRDFDSSHYHSNSYGRSYPSSSVMLHVSMCCEKCVQKVRKALKSVDDVESVDVDMHRQKVIVRGYVNPEKVLRKVRKVKKSATFWDRSYDYSSYNAGTYEYRHTPSPPAYDYDYDYYSPRSTSYDYYYTPSSTMAYNYDPYGRSSSYDYDYSRYNDRNHRGSSYDSYGYR